MLQTILKTSQQIIVQTSQTIVQENTQLNLTTKSHLKRRIMPTFPRKIEIVNQKLIV